VTKDIDFGQPAQRKKFYKAYITYKCTGDSNIRAKYAVNGTSTWYDFKQENLGRSVLSINGMPSTSVSGEANTYSVSPTGGNGHGLQLSIRVIFDPAEQEYLIDESDILNSGDGYVVGDIVTIPANALGAGSSSFTLTVASVDTTTDWQVDTLVPDVSSEANNIYSLKLKFEADGTVPADFEINDMSIIYRVKALK